jgi:hypothetical protein
MGVVFLDYWQNSMSGSPFKPVYCNKLKSKIMSSKDCLAA